MGALPYNMPAKQTDFALDRDEDGIRIMASMVRTTHVSPEVVRAIVRGCEESRRVMERFLDEADQVADVPDRDGWVRIGGGDLKTHLLGVFACRGGDKVDFAVAIYERNEPTAPILVLIGAQVEEFIRRARDVLQ